jgi:hypothetical protein
MTKPPSKVLFTLFVYNPKGQSKATTSLGMSELADDHLYGIDCHRTNTCFFIVSIHGCAWGSLYDTGTAAGTLLVRLSIRQGPGWRGHCQIWQFHCDMRARKLPNLAFCDMRARKLPNLAAKFGCQIWHAKFGIALRRASKIMIVSQFWQRRISLEHLVLS